MGHIDPDSGEADQHCSNGKAQQSQLLYLAFAASRVAQRIKAGIVIWGVIQSKILPAEINLKILINQL
jgi:hypothetical protein